MLVYNLNPVLFQINAFAVRNHWFFYVLETLLVIYILQSIFREKAKKAYSDPAAHKIAIAISIIALIALIVLSAFVPEKTYLLGPLKIRYYGLVYAVGFLAAYFLLLHFAKQKKIKNLNPDSVDALVIYLIFGTVIGARVFEFLFWETGRFLQNPLEIFYVWHGGMSFHGAIVGMALGIYLFSREQKVSFYQITDSLVLIGPLLLFFGRIANFINGELVGTATTPEATPWCVVFPHVDTLCRHPSQLYEAGYSLIIWLGLLIMQYRKKWVEGTIFWTFILTYGIFRFIANFWRDDKLAGLGLSTGQLFSLVMVFVACWFLYRINNAERHKQKS